MWMHFQNIYSDFWGENNSTYAQSIAWLNVQYRHKLSSHFYSQIFALFVL